MGCCCADPAGAFGAFLFFAEAEFRFTKIEEKFSWSSIETQSIHLLAADFRLWLLATECVERLVMEFGLDAPPAWPY